MINYWQWNDRINASLFSDHLPSPLEGIEADAAGVLTWKVGLWHSFQPSPQTSLDLATPSSEDVSQHGSCEPLSLHQYVEDIEGFLRGGKEVDIIDDLLGLSLNEYEQIWKQLSINIHTDPNYLLLLQACRSHDCYTTPHHFPTLQYGILSILFQLDAIPPRPIVEEWMQFLQRDHHISIGQFFTPLTYLPNPHPSIASFIIDCIQDTLPKPLYGPLLQDILTPSTALQVILSLNPHLPPDEVGKWTPHTFTIVQYLVKNADREDVLPCLPPLLQSLALHGQDIQSNLPLGPFLMQLLSKYPEACKPYTDTFLLLSQTLPPVHKRALLRKLGQ